MLSFVIQRLSQCDFATESIDAEHSIWVAAIREIVRECWVRVHIVGRDRRNDCSDLGSWEGINKQKKFITKLK